MNRKAVKDPEKRLALNAYVKLLRASDSLTDKVSKTWRDAGLTPSQFGVLEVLFHLGPLYQKDIAKKILKTTGNITMVIDNLSRRDLVYRERDTNDRRYFKIHLTDKGMHLIERIFPGHVDDISRILSVFSAEEQQKFADMCKKLGLSD